MYPYPSYLTSPNTNRPLSYAHQPNIAGPSFQSLYNSLGGGAKSNQGILPTRVPVPVDPHPLENYGLRGYGLPHANMGGYGANMHGFGLDQMFGPISMMAPSYFNYMPTFINWSNMQGMLQGYDDMYGEYFRGCKKKHVEEDDDDCGTHKCKKKKKECEDDDPPPPKTVTPPPTTPTPPPTTPTPPTTPPATPHPWVTGKITGDPHFVGADGERYDIHPINGRKYKLIADENMALNAEFQPYVPGAEDNGKIGVENRGRPVMKKLGLKLGNETLEMATDDKTGLPIIKVNGQLMADTATRGFDKDGFNWNKNTNTLSFNKTVNGETWNMRLVWNDRKGNGSFFDVFIERAELGKNGTATSGLWGHSVGGEKTAEKNGVGVLRDANGNLLKAGTATNSEDYKKALAGYEVSSLI